MSAGRNKNSRSRHRNAQRARVRERKRRRMFARRAIRSHNAAVGRKWAAYFMKLYGTVRLI